MSEFIEDFAGVKMCLNHSQSQTERGLCDLEAEFRRWQEKPKSRSIRSKLVEDLENFRWLLDQHFTRVAGEGFLERILNYEPSLYSELRDIECWQVRLLDHLDEIIDRVRQSTDEPAAINRLVTDFISLHDDILREESEERYLVERGVS
jgi:hypothetical protein